MTRPRDYQTEAIIIKKTKLGEADRILTLYTPGLGKIQAVAKGVRRPKSKLSGHLELLTHSQVTLARGHNLDTITGSQTINSLMPLKTDLWLTSYGLYVTELVNQFTAEHVGDERLFRLLLDTLQNLCETNNRELLLRYFEIHLLEEAGYRPQLQECVACHRVLEPVTNSFCANIGGMLCPECSLNQPFARPISVNALKVLRFIQRNDYNAVGRLKINSALSLELEAITRSYLKYLLERDVRSANWLDELKEQMKQMGNLKGNVKPVAEKAEVDFQVGQGEVVGIIGHTGSGKSTLIQHLNALFRPQRGQVRVFDFDLSDKKLDARKLRQRVGLVFQFPEAQLFEQYVGDDVAFGPWQMGLRGEELRACVREAMDAVGLPFDSFKDRALYSLSGGERRRAALAGVLAIKPEILVLDEPTAGLDPRGHKDILDRLMTLHRDAGMTLVIVSHNMEDIARMCDRVYVIADGKSILSGTPREVFAQSQRLVELGLGVPQVTAAFHALRERGVDVRTDVLTVEEAASQWTVDSGQ